MRHLSNGRNKEVKRAERSTVNDTRGSPGSGQLKSHTKEQEVEHNEQQISQKKNYDRILHFRQRKFPSQLLIKLGHCRLQSGSSDFGRFYDYNTDFNDPNIPFDTPFRLFYNQGCYQIRFRLLIRQVSTFG